jgi:hypothetical protein
LRWRSCRCLRENPFADGSVTIEPIGAPISVSTAAFAASGPLQWPYERGGNAGDRYAEGTESSPASAWQKSQQFLP